MHRILNIFNYRFFCTPPGSSSVRSYPPNQSAKSAQKHALQAEKAGRHRARQRNFDSASTAFSSVAKKPNDGGSVIRGSNNKYPKKPNEVSFPLSDNGFNTTSMNQRRGPKQGSNGSRDGNNEIQRLLKRRFHNPPEQFGTLSRGMMPQIEPLFPAPKISLWNKLETETEKPETEFQRRKRKNIIDDLPEIAVPKISEPLPWTCPGLARTIKFARIRAQKRSRMLS